MCAFTLTQNFHYLKSLGAFLFGFEFFLKPDFAR